MTHVSHVTVSCDQASRDVPQPSLFLVSFNQESWGVHQLKFIFFHLKYWDISDCVLPLCNSKWYLWYKEPSRLIINRSGWLCYSLDYGRECVTRGWRGGRGYPLCCVPRIGLHICPSNLDAHWLVCIVFAWKLSYGQLSKLKALTTY